MCCLFIGVSLFSGYPPGSPAFVEGRPVEPPIAIFLTVLNRRLGVRAGLQCQDLATGVMPRVGAWENLSTAISRAARRLLVRVKTPSSSDGGPLRRDDDRRCAPSPARSGEPGLIPKVRRTSDRPAVIKALGQGGKLAPLVHDGLIELPSTAAR
jgi:hypothetical protein